MVKKNSYTTNSKRYGIIPANTEIPFPDGYVVFIGGNNAGKSTILQFLFTKVLHDSSVNSKEICFIPKNRDCIAPSTNAGPSLEQLNQQLQKKVANGPMVFDQAKSVDFTQLYTGILNNYNLYKSIGNIQEKMELNGFGQYSVEEGQRHHVGNVEVIAQGAGLRCVMPIYAAIANPNIKCIFIDEPETSLEAGKCRSLKEEMLEACRSAGKTIVVATHSHLFLNNEEVNKNFILDNSNGAMSIQQIKNEGDFSSVAFDLLGSNLSDLYMPNNFLFVEGVSDQIIAQKVCDLLGKSKFDLRIISCTGLPGVPPTIGKFKETLAPIIEHNSPYATKIVGLIDKPLTDSDIKIKEALENQLKDRLFILHESSLEEYLDESLYTKASLVKATEIKRISDAGKDHTRKSTIKRDISNKVASILTLDDLPLLKEFTEAVERATN